MANYTTTSLEATKYLCGLIRDLASVSEGIDDINLRSDGTFSSVMIDTLIKKCLEDSNKYTEKLVANLSRLELKLVTSESEITESNILYLFKPDGATSYNQYAVIEGNKVLLGTCDINMADYINAADVAKDYATKVELKAVTDKIGTTTLTTTNTTITGAIEEVKGIVDGKAEILDSEKNDVNTWSSNKIVSEITEVGTELNAKLNELENITRLTDFDEAIPEKGKNKIYYVNKLIGTYKCAQWRVESMYYDVSELKQYRGVQKATAINGVDNIMLMREYYLGDDDVIHWGDWVELATTDSTLKTIQLSGSVDCNTLTELGLYTASAGAVSALTNVPVNNKAQLDGGFSILVTKTNVDGVYYGMQMLIPYGSDAPFIRKAYYFNYEQYWTSWEQLATMDNFGLIPIETNRTITFSNNYTGVSVYRCGYNNIRAHIEIDVLCNITSIEGWIQDMGIVLPEGYRPSENMSIPAWCSSDTENHMPIILMIGADGKISGYIGGSHKTINRLGITVTYFK